MARVFSEDGAVLALAQREHSEQERARWVPKQFRANDLHVVANDADAAVVTATKAVDIIPPNVQAQSDQAKACRAMHATRLAALKARGVDAIEARKQLAVLAGRCDSLSASARQALESYRENARKELAEAQDRQNKAHAAVAQVETAIAKKLSEAEGIERGGITGGSNGVLDAVVNANPTAKRKWWYIFGSLLALECLPLLLKVLSRRSSVGMRILVEEALRIDGHLRRRDEALHAAEQRAIFRRPLDEARDAAICTDEVQSDLARSAARQSPPPLRRRP